MRHRASPLLCGILAVLLVLLQHGAVLHGFAHERQGAAHGTELADLDLVHDAVCEVCLAYAAVGAAPPPALPHTGAVAADAELPGHRAGFVAAAAACYAARAPPPFLV